MLNSSNADAGGKEWESIWKRRNLISDAVNSGRSFYNGYFRRLIRKYLNKDTRMLELGCGTSTLAISLAPEIKELVGLDISPEALELSRRHAGSQGVTNARFISGNCLDLAIENEYDIVWSQGLMEHFDDPKLIARQHYKALKKGGVALISVPYRISFYTPWYKITRTKALRSLWPWTEQVFFTKKQLLEIGQSITPNARVFMLTPAVLGIAILELKKDRCDPGSAIFSSK